MSTASAADDVTSVLAVLECSLPRGELGISVFLVDSSKSFSTLFPFLLGESLGSLWPRGRLNRTRGVDLCRILLEKNGFLPHFLATALSLDFLPM